MADHHQHYPPEYWVLLELVLAGCPEPALKMYRDLVVGKGKGQQKILKATQADAAIRAANGWRYGTMKEPTAVQLRDAVPENGATAVRRNREMYLPNNWPAIFVRRSGEEWTVQVQEYRRDCVPEGHEEYLMEFDDEAVDRLAN